MKTDISALEQPRSLKYLQVVNAIVGDIEKGTLALGDRLPSINEACAEWYLSKDSVKRAYETLYQLGFVTSINRKGFFIAGHPKRHALRVLIVAGQLTDGVKQLHDAIATQLKRDVILDIGSYNYQRHLLCQLLNKHLGDYHYFVLMPHLAGPDPTTLQCLRNVPARKLILIGNQWANALQHGHQLHYGSERVFYDALVGQLPMLRRYERLNLVLPENDGFDADSIRVFRQFCTAHDFDYQIIDELTDEDMRPRQAYFVADSRSLIALVDYCRRNDLRLGQDLGVVSLAESDFTRLLAGSVSVIAHPQGELARQVVAILGGQFGAGATPQTAVYQPHLRASC